MPDRQLLQAGDSRAVPDFCKPRADRKADRKHEHPTGFEGEISAGDGAQALRRERTEASRKRTLQPLRGSEAAICGLECARRERIFTRTEDLVVSHCWPTEVPRVLLGTAGAALWQKAGRGRVGRLCER